MKIGIDVRKLRDYGIGTHIRNVVLPAAEMASSHQFYLYHDRASEIQEQKNFRWITEDSGKYSVREHFSLARKAKENGIELFHSPHYTLPFGLHCKSIVTVHDLIHIKFHHLFPGWKVKAAQFVIKKALSRADLIVTVSNTSRNDLMEFFPDAEQKIEVLYNRISADWLDTPKPLDLSSMGVAPEFILYVGNFKKHKGLETLMEAYAHLQKPPMLVLVGNSGSAEDSLMQQIFSTHGVRLLGFAEGNLLRTLYSKAMLFVFPSLYEGFGYPPVEAMACGAPVLSSDAPALREILAESAEFFNRGNVESLTEKLENLIGDSQRRADLIRLGKAQAQKFATDESPRRLAAIYDGFAR
jgi:glycosyltransferase involved in cell wall biosynthesis